MTRFSRDCQWVVEDSHHLIRKQMIPQQKGASTSMNGRRLGTCRILLVALVATAGMTSIQQSAARTTRTIDVPEDAPTLAAAIAAAAAGDTIVLEAGTYSPSVTVPGTKHGLTIRGVDRNQVIFDGRGTHDSAITVRANGVTVENLSAHSYRGNVFYWDEVDGFNARYLTVWNIQGYGVYAEHSTGGIIAHDYVSGAADAAYYIGECRPCNSVIEHVVARLSAVGYSGTNASGGLVIRDSVWDRNATGIIPNSYANEEHPPQQDSTIVRNLVTGSGSVPVPLHTALAGFYGIGIAIAGGRTNRIAGNTVSRSARYGIAVFPTDYWLPIDPRPRPSGRHKPWNPVGNTVTGNRVGGSKIADLALAGGSHNCFTHNAAVTSAPSKLLRTGGCTSTGSALVARDLTQPIRTMMDRAFRRFPPPSFESMPVPPAQPSMPE